MNSIFLLIIMLISIPNCYLAGYLGLIPPGCDEVAASKCEYDFLYCKLFSGPANDPATLCKCSRVFYGDCIANAGCLTSPQVDELSSHQIYMKNCINEIIANDCPDPLQCAINCASSGVIDPSASKIIPFNNYGQYYLRVKICVNKVHQQKLSRYSTVDVVPCSKDSDFLSCNRFIPPLTFVPVALPVDTTYIEVDSCIFKDETYKCLPSSYSTRIYGSQFLFPRSFDVPRSNVSICATNDDCLGSFCDFHQRPAVCSPKSLSQVEKSGKFYFSDPFN